MYVPNLAPLIAPIKFDKKQVNPPLLAGDRPQNAPNFMIFATKLQKLF
jgi:hypothetical protein